MGRRRPWRLGFGPTPATAGALEDGRDGARTPELQPEHGGRRRGALGLLHPRGAGAEEDWVVGGRARHGGGCRGRHHLRPRNRTAAPCPRPMGRGGASLDPAGMETGGSGGVDSKGRDLVGDSGWMEGRGWEGRGGGPSVSPPHRGRGGGPRFRVWVEKGRQQAEGGSGRWCEAARDAGRRGSGARGGGGKSKGVGAEDLKATADKARSEGHRAAAERRTVFLCPFCFL